MNQHIEGPKRISTTRFHFTPNKTRETANWVEKFGKAARYTYIASATILFLRIIWLIVSGYNPWAQGLIILIMAAPCTGLAAGMLIICLMQIWSDANDYHARNDRLWLARHIHEGSSTWIDMEKKKLYVLWAHLNNGISIASLILMFIASTGGWLAAFSIGAGISNTFWGAFFAGNWVGSAITSGIFGSVGTYITISFYITHDHMTDDADQHEQYREKYNKIRGIQEVKEIMAAQQMGTTVPAGSLDQANAMAQLREKQPDSVTAQFKTMGESVNLPLRRPSMDNLPSKQRKRRQEEEV